MKAMLFGGATLSLLTVSAFGADLGPNPRLNPPPLTPFSWTGCYAGLHAGGGMGQSDFADTAGVLAPQAGFSAVNLDTSGYMLGGQIGCDYQFASNWVIGIEGAAAGGDIGGSTGVAQPLAIPGDTANFKETTDFLTSATGRVGYTWDHWLLYANGGVAFADDRYTAIGTFTGAAFNLAGVETRLGWTAGAGVEWALGDDWSVQLEYDYYGFGQRSVFFIDNTGTGISGPAEIKQNIQVLKLGVNFRPSFGP